MWAYNYTIYPSELYHHGVLGMRWGKRNGPPYPLGTEGRQANRRVFRREGRSDAPKEKSKHRSRLEERYRSKGMNQSEAEKAAAKRIKIEKIIAVAGVMTVTAATAYVIHKKLGKEKFGGILNKSVSEITKHGKLNLPTWERIPTTKEALKASNPSGHTKNCVGSVLAFELNKQGYKVEALSSNTLSLKAVCDIFGKKASDVKTISSETDKIKELKRVSNSWGEGSRGFLGLYMKNGDHHAAAFERALQKTDFLDPQTKNGNFEKVVASAEKIIYFRMDNANFVEEAILPFIKKSI